MEISKQTKSKIKFIKSNEKINELDPKSNISSYYQICQFKSKFTKKYQTRKIIFNEKHEILKIFKREYDYQDIDNFIKHHRSNKYKIYPYDNIDDVELPSTTEIIASQSELLNKDNQEYGYCGFGECNN